MAEHVEPGERPDGRTSVPALASEAATPPHGIRVLGLCPTARLAEQTVAFLLATRAAVQRGGVEGVSGFDVYLTTDNPHPVLANDDDGAKLNVLHNYRKGRAVALAGGYDAVLVCESDIAPPPDALARLARLLRGEHERQRGVRADLAYGYYAFRPRDYDERPAAYEPAELRGPAVNVFERLADPGACRNPGSPLRSGALRRALRRGVVPCSGGGLGLVLIRRAVLEAVDFRATDGRPGLQYCDSLFTRDVWAAGFEQWADLGARCGHVTPGGRVISPPTC